VHAAEGDKAHDADMTIAEIATVHEFEEFGPPGDKGVRSPIRGWFDENRKLLQSDIRTVVSQGLSPDVLALRMQAGIQGRISAGIAPPNSEQTKTLKGSSKPLVDTGLLKSSYLAKVVTS
jgi:hypothetical protein